MRIAFGLCVLGALAACGSVNPELAAQRCEERARAAQGPEGGLTVGVNSNSGSFASARVGISLDALRGSDPQAVYDDCVLRMTGEIPVRPLTLKTR